MIESFSKMIYNKSIFLGKSIIYDLMRESMVGENTLNVDKKTSYKKEACYYDISFLSKK